MSSTPDPDTADIPSQETSDKELPFIEHLIELRNRLVRAIISIAVVAIALAIYPGASKLYDWLALPLASRLPEGGKMLAIGVVTPFMVPIKILFMTSLVVALPFVLYQIWAFIAPGLYRHEKRLIAPLVASSTLLFYTGMAFCYFFVFGKVFTFIMHFSPQAVNFAPDINEYLSFVLTMFMAFGLAFEVPIAVILLVRLGVVPVAKLKKARGYVVVGAFVIAALITPPDVVSQLLLAIPMCLLYEVGVWVGQMIKPKKDLEDNDDEDEEQ